MSMFKPLVLTGLLVAGIAAATVERAAALAARL